MSEKKDNIELDDLEMYISRSKQINKKENVLFEEPSLNKKTKKVQPKPKKEEVQPKPKKEEVEKHPKKHPKKQPEKETITENEENIIVEDKISKEDLILQKLAYLEQGINNIIEAIPEIVNQSISDYKDIKNKIAVLEDSIVYNSSNKPKIVKFHRNESGQIEKAEME